MCCDGRSGRLVAENKQRTRNCRPPRGGLLASECQWIAGSSGSGSGPRRRPRHRHPYSRPNPVHIRCPNTHARRKPPPPATRQQQHLQLADVLDLVRLGGPRPDDRLERRLPLDRQPVRVACHDSVHISPRVSVSRCPQHPASPHVRTPPPRPFAPPPPVPPIPARTDRGSGRPSFPNAGRPTAHSSTTPIAARAPPAPSPGHRCRSCACWLLPAPRGRHADCFRHRRPRHPDPVQVAALPPTQGFGAWRASLAGADRGSIVRVTL